MRAHRIVALTHANDAIAVANRSNPATPEAKNRAAGRNADNRLSRS
ncbi:ABC transporter substrate-binding protein, partial [Burkholderia multivorans]